MAKNHSVSVLHVCSDPNLKTEYEIVESEEESIFSVVIYYKQIKNKIPFLAPYLKKQKLLELYEIGFQIIQKKRRSIPDIIQLNVVLPAGIGAKFLSGKYHIPMVINECWTGYMPADGNYKGFVTKYFTKKIVSRAKAIMPVSESLKQDMLNHGLNGNYQIVPNVVDVELFKPNASIQKASNKTRFIHISTFDQEQKNVVGILNAFEKAYHKDNSIELSFIGNLTHAEFLQNLVEQKNIKQAVYFKGPLSKIDLITEINSHDALIMFSNYESFCLVIAEAMSCGIPVITSKCGGITNTLPDYAGIKVESKNENQLCEAIERLSKNKSQYKVENIQQFIVNNFSSAIINKRLTEVYQSVLKS